MNPAIKFNVSEIMCFYIDVKMAQSISQNKDGVGFTQHYFFRH